MCDVKSYSPVILIFLPARQSIVDSKGSFFAAGLKAKDMLSREIRIAPGIEMPQVVVLTNSIFTLSGATVMVAWAGAKVKRPNLTYAESARRSPRMGGRG